MSVFGQPGGPRRALLAPAVLAILLSTASTAEAGGGRAKATQAGGGLATAPAALPQLWAVELDGNGLAALDRRTRARMRAGRVALVAPERGALRARIRRTAGRAGLAVFAPTRTAGACEGLLRARPAARCGVRVRSTAAARRLARGGRVDLVMVPARRRSFSQLGRGTGSGRVLAALPLSSRAFRARAWRGAIRAAGRSRALDLAVRPTGRRPGRALKRFLSLLERHGPRDRRPPGAPGEPAVSGGSGSTVTLAWRAPKRRGVTFGLYRGGRRVGAPRGASARLSGLGCGGARVAVDAVDHAGNRSAKRAALVFPPGCGPRGGGGGGGPGGLPYVPGNSGYNPPPSDPSVPATRFVAPGGSDAGDCGRAAPCASLDRAYRVARPGEAVDVAAGTYGNQSIGALAGRVGPSVVLRAAAGARVVLAGLDIDGADHVTVAGMTLATRTAEPGAGNQEGVGVGPGSSHVALERIDAGSVHTWFADRVIVRGGDYGPCHAVWDGPAVCGNSKLDVSTNVTIDGARFHGYRFDQTCFSVAGADCHWECMYINAGQNVTIRNSRFRDCAIFDIFATISGPDAAQMGHENLTIENNWFATPWTEDAGGGSPARPTAVSLAWCQNSSRGYRNVRVRFNSFQRNASLEIDSNQSCVFDNVQVVGNLMMWDGCQPRWAWAHNGWSTAVREGTCGASDRIVGNTFPYRDGGGGASMDYHLAGASAADNLVPVSAGCPPTDIDGHPRGAGGFCDAGADER